MPTMRRPIPTRTLARVMKSNLIKLAVAVVLVGVMVAWQQRYFQAIDDVDATGTTLWNWPAAILIVFGVVALAIAAYRLISKRIRHK